MKLYRKLLMSFTQNLFHILDKHEANFKLKFANSNHHVFKAHFPSNPILPGFLQIDIAEMLLNISIKKIKKSKFLSPIKPNDIIDYFCDTNKKKVTLFKNNNKMTEFIYE